MQQTLPPTQPQSRRSAHALVSRHGLPQGHSSSPAFILFRRGPSVPSGQFPSRLYVQLKVSRENAHRRGCAGHRDRGLSQASRANRAPMPSCDVNPAAKVIPLHAPHPSLARVGDGCGASTPKMIANRLCEACACDGSAGCFTGGDGVRPCVDRRLMRGLFGADDPSHTGACVPVSLS